MRTFFAMVIALAVAGCAAASPSPTPTSVATVSPTPAATSTPSPSPTPTPALSASPTAIATATPTALPSPSSPPSSSPSPSATATSAGDTVEVIAGGGSSAPAVGLSAQDVALQRPTGVAVGPDGSIWIVDANLGMLIHVGTDGVIAQVVSGLIDPEGVAVAPDGTPYVAEPGSYRVASIGANGKLTTVAGNPNQAGDQGDGGLARRSLLLHPQDVATDGQGNLFIADAAAQRIRLVASATGKISTVAGNGTGGLSGDNGPATSAQIYGAQAVAIDAQGTRLLIADTTNHRLRQVDLVSGVITSIAGAGDTAVAYDPSLSGMQTPLTRISALALDPDGNAYFPVFWGNLGLTVMRMDANGKMARVLGGGPTQAAGTAPLDFALPDVLGLAIVPDTGTLLVCGSDGRVYSVPNVVVPI